MKDCMIVTILDKFDDALTEANVILPNPEKDEDPDAANLYGTQYGDLYYYINSYLVETFDATTAPICKECERVFLETLTKKEVLEWLDTMCEKLMQCVTVWEDRQIAFDIYDALFDVIPESMKRDFVMNVQMDLRSEIRRLIHATIVCKLNNFVAGIRNYRKKDYFQIRFLKAYVNVMGNAIQEEIEEAACEREATA